MRILFLLLFLTACARPEYVAAPDSARGGEQKGVTAPACDLKFEKAGLCLSWSWMQVPDEHTPGSMRVKIWRPNLADASPVLMAVPAIGAFLKMANMPHGSSPVSIHQVDVGTYVIANVFFSMHGPWYIFVQLKDSAGNESDKLQIDYRF